MKLYRHLVASYTATTEYEFADGKFECDLVASNDEDMYSKVTKMIGKYIVSLLGKPKFLRVDVYKAEPDEVINEPVEVEPNEYEQIKPNVIDNEIEYI